MLGLLNRLLDFILGKDDNDWWELMADPFLPAEWKRSLLATFPEKFPRGRCVVGD